MKRYLVKTPKLVHWLFPRRIWAFSSKDPIVYLTFDDGPIPEVTPWVLDLLKEFNAKATFFCIGNNIEKHPQIFSRILTEGHAVGNHTFHHLKGTQTSVTAYLEDIIKCEKAMLLQVQHGGNSHNPDSLNVSEIKLFRPPYGKMTPAQAKMVRKKGYQTVMWDVLSADFDTEISKEKCLQNVLKNIKAGSIVIFHDSLKAEKNIRYALPKVLDFMVSNGYSMQSI